MDDLAVDLILKMLAMNPADRITARDALNHPYFKTSPFPSEPDKIPIIEGELKELDYRDERY